LDRALADYPGGTPEAVANWISVFAAALALGARETLAICEAVQRG
jgi:hypothetical protein